MKSDQRYKRREEYGIPPPEIGRHLTVVHTSDIAHAMLQRLYQDQVSDILDEFNIDINAYPVELSSRSILKRIIDDGSAYIRS